MIGPGIGVPSSQGPRAGAVHDNRWTIGGEGLASGGAPIHRMAKTLLSREKEVGDDFLLRIAQRNTFVTLSFA